MPILVDTGVLLRAFDRASPLQRTILRALRKLWAANEELVTSSQNIAEFWNVSTRPMQARGGLGLPFAVVDERVKLIESLGRVLPFSDQAYVHWRKLVIDHQIVGVSVHDAKLVATMQAMNIACILTLNEADFRRYAGLNVLTPEAVISP